MTGTPGVGKSAVAARLARTLNVVEVGDFAVRTGWGQRTGTGVRVDLPALVRRFPALHRAHPHDVYVGHLAHLLPIHDALVLRCHPVELGRRLARARRGSCPDQNDNVTAEAIDLVLREAVNLGRRVWEVDTTGRTPEGVAREVQRRLARRGPARYGRVDWLADPRVTDYLLGRVL